MPKFTLTAEHMDIYGKPTGDKVTVEFNKEYLPDVLDQMELFLRGVGYSQSGVLDFIDDETMVATTQAGIDALAAFHGYTREEPEIHSDHYFDTERNK